MQQYKFRFWDGERMIYNGYGEANCSFNGLLVCEGDTIALMWTGLKDKNGKEIYEGDVVHVVFPSEPNGTDEITVVTISDTFRGVQLIVNGTSTEVRVKNPEYLEIIGNVWENPELLTNN